MQVTTLVPAYKPKYLFELLSSLRHQTVKPAAIVFSDDSADQAFVRLLEAKPLKSTIADLDPMRWPMKLAPARPAAEASFLAAWGAFAT